MSPVTFQGEPLKLAISAPEVDNLAPYFSLTKADFSEASLDDYGKKYKLLNIFLSLDSSVCSKSVHEFLKRAKSHSNLAILNISFDLPTAFERFCTTEKIKGGSEMLSCFRSHFAEDYGIYIVDGMMRGLCARSVFILDGNNRIVYREIAPEITREPDYESALKALPKQPQAR